LGAFRKINSYEKIKEIILLNIGDKAPDFTLPNTENKSISLKDFYGKKIILWFFPKASTPG
tara:strand:+ start:427 stop:609 length:183 start_codon:yes stop_codon:yes gene_type:complete